jgi:hypothetical protein
MVKCCVFFAVQTEFLNTIYTHFDFKGLMNTELEGVSKKVVVAQFKVYPNISLEGVTKIMKTSVRIDGLWAKI